MGKPKKHQSGGAQNSVNSYERERMIRVQQNQARLQECGIQNLANSFSSLVESHKSKKRKTRSKMLCNEHDPDYEPNVDKEDNEEETATSDGVQKEVTKGTGQHHRYIPPMSLKKKLLSSTKQQPSRVDDQLEKLSKTRPQEGRTTLTMAELIARKSQPKNDNGRPEDVNVEFIEERLNECEDKEDELENMDEDDSEDESLDFDLMNEDDAEDEPVNLEELEGQECEIEVASEKEKGVRGPTMMHSVHTRSKEKRKAIILNEFGQPIGPVTEEEDTVGEFSRFLGTIARDYDYAPLIHKSWHYVPSKDKMWDYVLGKYIVPEEGKDWTLKTIGAAWRSYKCRFKKKYYYKYKDNKTRLNNRPRRVPEADFIKLLAKWNKKEEQKLCEQNRARRKSQKNMHTAGPKSFARIREEMKNEDPNKQPPTLAQLFERTRQRKEGKVYVEPFDDTSKKIEAMKNYNPPEDGSGPVDPFLAVMQKEYDGHRRLYGKGVTNKVLKKVSCCGSSYVVPDEVMDSFRANVEAEKTQILELKKQLEADYERKKGELEAEHAKKMAELEDAKKDFDIERESMAEDILRKLLSKLPSDIAKRLSA